MRDSIAAKPQRNAALQFSQKAKNWAIWGIVLSILVYILVFAFYGAVLFAAFDI